MTENGRSATARALASSDQHWLDALPDAVVILSPVYGRRRRIVDFRVDYANAAASDLDHDQSRGGVCEGFLIGRGFLDLKPPAAVKLAALFRAVLRTGEPCALDGIVFETGVNGQKQRQVRDVRATRLGDRLLVSFRDVTERRRSEEEVRRNEESLRALVDDVSDEALITVDPGGNVTSWNTGAQQMYGYRSAEIMGRHYSVLYPRGWLDGAHAEQKSPAVAERRQQNETWQVRKRDQRFWASVSITSIHGANRELRGFSLVTRDLTEQLGHQRRELQLEVVGALEGCSRIDAAADRFLELTTAGLTAALGEMVITHSADDGTLQSSRHSFAPRAPDVLEPSLDHQTDGHWHGLAARVLTTGALVNVPDLGEVGGPAEVAAAAALGLRSAIACPIFAGSEIVGVLAYFFNTLPRALAPETVTEIAAVMGRFVTRARAQTALEQELLKLTELASTDRLTGLKNRREFDRMMSTLPRQPFAVLAIDIDHLKLVNDEYGHEAGDLVLRTVGTTLALMLRGWDVIARVGGDEFAAILLDVDAAEAATAAQRLRASMHLVPDDRSTISVGWVSAPAGADPLSVWNIADECLRTAKREGRDRVVGHRVEDGEHAAPAGVSATELISDLIAGLPLHSVYQPIVDLNDGHVVGYEALARPQGFGASDSVEVLFEVAHRSRQIRDLDWLCRRAALSQATALPAGVMLFINVSLAALLDPLHDVDQMLLLLKWTGRSADRLVLEIGEHERIRDFGRLKRVLSSYRKAGIRFAIDDLRDGSPTLELLGAVRAEYIKLDRSLTMSSVGKNARATLEPSLAFARSNDAVVIAEGIENEFVSDQIRSLGIGLGQGYGLGRPSAAADAADTVATWNARAALRPLRPRDGRSRSRMAATAPPQERRKTYARPTVVPEEITS